MHIYRTLNNYTSDFYRNILLLFFKILDISSSTPATSEKAITEIAGKKKFKSSYVTTFYEAIVKTTENLNICDISGIRRVLYIYGRTSFKLSSEGSSSIGDGAIVSWRKHCIRVLMVCVTNIC